MQIAIFGGAAEFIASGRSIHVATSWGERLEDGVHPIDSFLVTSDHHAIAPLETPDTAAGSNIQVMNT